MKLYVLKIDGFVTDIGYFPDRLSKSNVEKPALMSLLTYNKSYLDNPIYLYKEFLDLDIRELEITYQPNLIKDFKNHYTVKCSGFRNHNKFSRLSSVPFLKYISDNHDTMVRDGKHNHVSIPLIVAHYCKSGLHLNFTVTGYVWIKNHLETHNLLVTVDYPADSKMISFTVKVVNRAIGSKFTRKILIPTYELTDALHKRSKNIEELILATLDNAIPNGWTLFDPNQPEPELEPLDAEILKI